MSPPGPEYLVSFENAHRDDQFVQPNDAVSLGPHRHWSRVSYDELGKFAPVNAGLGPMASSHHGDRRTVRARRSRLSPLMPLAIAAAAILVFMFATDGGQTVRTTLPATAYLGKALKTLGLGLEEVTISGQQETKDSDIADRLMLAREHSIWVYDIAAARARIEELPWVDKASLKRAFPDRLHVEIQERVPRAIWRDAAHAPTLIDMTGRRLGAAKQGQFADLPVVFGTGAPRHIDAILSAVRRIPDLAPRIGLYEWTANRRWTLHLKTGQRILLPAQGQSAALIRLTEGQPGATLLDSDFTRLDLRLPEQLAIEFRDRGKG